MGKFRVEVIPEAQAEISKHLKSGNQASIKKIAKILEELSETPFEGVGKPEALKHNFSGFWSREINKKDRLIYSVEEEIVTVVVISAMGHYSDK
ncbi:Toxin YoeB [compost metagenome]|jgi:toxin YoeB|uniref:Txe/YoeB family addiction module toxin n=1 Tax=Flavobacterium sp. LC2016-12 TaxID=2783794 RepID=UPI000FB15E71|nr:Txe/YoeB family addiction module toxin [Flavobacterium sp. LC2016-12]MBF4466918.1 Txe/YoeB family addiction module toxin [Flavobacterium sp. LC2016-12]